MKILFENLARLILVTSKIFLAREVYWRVHESFFSGWSIKH